MSFTELTRPSAVIQALKEFDALGRTKFLAKYGFGKAKEYMLRDRTSRKLYDSKAIVGAAHGYQFPRRGPLKSNDFSGGEHQSQKKLEALGFNVVKVGTDWSAREIRLVVEDYFKMLELQAAGEEFNKSERNQKLRRRLTHRSKGSVELKHQNISAILRKEGFPIVLGYKARGNFQEKLKLAVLDYLRDNSVRVRLRKSLKQSDAVPASSKNPSWRNAFVQPPQFAAPPKAKSKSARTPRKIDYAERDFKNRSLGRAGEEWVCRLERKRLRDEGRPGLAGKVELISLTMGDGAGYDVRSFNVDGSVRFIEVKTTKGGAHTPFMLSRNEIEFSVECGRAFYLYRVFNFGQKALFYTLKGSLRNSVWLAPQEYRAMPRGRPCR